MGDHGGSGRAALYRDRRDCRDFRVEAGAAAAFQGRRRQSIMPDAHESWSPRHGIHLGHLSRRDLAAGACAGGARSGAEERSLLVRIDFELSHATIRRPAFASKGIKRIGYVAGRLLPLEHVAHPGQTDEPESRRAKGEPFLQQFNAKPSFKIFHAASRTFSSRSRRHTAKVPKHDRLPVAKSGVLNQNLGKETLVLANDSRVVEDCSTSLGELPNEMFAVFGIRTDRDGFGNEIFSSRCRFQTP